MRFIAGAVALSIAAQSLPGVLSQEEVTSPAPGSQPFSYDLNTGLVTQLQTSEESAPQLEYTTENGAAYTNPYDAWKIGSNGKTRSCFCLVLY